MTISSFHGIHRLSSLAIFTHSVRCACALVYIVLPRVLTSLSFSLLSIVSQHLVSSSNFITATLLNRFIVKEFNGKRHLSTLFSDSTIEEISDIDIGYVAEDSSDTDTFSHHQLHNVRILGVKYLDELKKCLNCNSKVVVGIDSTCPEIGECTKC